MSIERCSRRRMRLVVPLSAALGGLVGSSMVCEASAASYRPRFVRASCPQQVLLAHPPSGFRCGYLVVPENRSRPAGRRIRLAVGIVPAVARRPARDPLVYLTGGPGGIAFGETKNAILGGLNRRREVVLVEQRGTYLSQPALVCPGIDVFSGKLSSLRYDAASTGREHVAATRRCRRRLAAGGHDLSAYDTQENAADVADLRRALGYRRYDVYGVSYGTDLALTLMRDHPQGIRSVILDSTVPPSVARFHESWPNAADGFQNIFRACAAQPGCRHRNPHLRRSFTGLVRQLEAHPLRVTVQSPVTDQPTTVVIDGGGLVNWLVATSLNTPLLKYVPDAISELAAGRPQTIATQWLAPLQSLAAHPGYVGYGLVYGVFCREFAPGESERQVIAAGRRAFPGYPRSVLAQPPQLPFIFGDCRVWHVPPSPPSTRLPTRSRIPTLLLSGSFDAATSLRWTRVAARTLSRSTIVRVPGLGHQLLPQSACVQTVAASFLNRPDAPNTHCVPRQRVPTFVPPPPS